MGAVSVAAGVIHIVPSILSGRSVLTLLPAWSVTSTMISMATLLD